MYSWAVFLELNADSRNPSLWIWGLLVVYRCAIDRREERDFYWEQHLQHAGGDGRSYPVGKSRDDHGAIPYREPICFKSDSALNRQCCVGLVFYSQCLIGKIRELNTTGMWSESRYSLADS